MSGLSVGSFFRHPFTKALNSLLQPPLSGRVGGDWSRMRRITFMWGYYERGAAPNAISIAVIPNDQMSAEVSWPYYCMTSGAIQHGEPQTVLFFCPFFIWADTPKSDRSTSPSMLSKILPAFISLWILPFECKYRSPCIVSRRIVAITASSATPLAPVYALSMYIISVQAPASTICMTIQRKLALMKATCSETMFRWRDVFMMALSLRNSPIDESSNWAQSTILIATTYPACCPSRH